MCDKEEKQQVKILVGISGSGKSTLAIAMDGHYPVPFGQTPWVVCSADHFMTNERGMYEFCVSKLPFAHHQCMKKYINLIQDGNLRTVVDNTNCSMWEIAPYVAIASAYGAEVEIIVLHCSVEDAYERTLHETPLKNIIDQHRRLQKLLDEFPFFWTVSHKLTTRGR